MFSRTQNIHVRAREPVQGGKAEAGVFYQYRTPDLNYVRYLLLGPCEAKDYTSSAALLHLSVETSSIVPWISTRSNDWL